MYLYYMHVYFMYSIIYICNMHMWSFPDGSVIKIPLPVQAMWILSLGGEDLLEKEMATHSSILA